MQTRAFTIALIAWGMVGCTTPAASTGELPPTPIPPTETQLPPPAAPPATLPPTEASEPAVPPEDTPSGPTSTPRPTGQIIEFDIPPGSRPHDVAPAPDSRVWYTGQRAGEMGLLDPATGEVTFVELPAPSAPHGVIVGPDGAAWITDGGANAIVRIDPDTLAVESFPLPPERPNTNLNTAVFDRNGILWFTGQNGIYGRLDPASGEMVVYDAPRGSGPYGITATPDGEIYYASLAGSYIAHVDIETGEATVIEPPTPNQGARRVWSDSKGRIWVSEWNVGQLGLYDPASGAWHEWPLPGSAPRAYAVYVDEQDGVWVTDFGGNALVRFDPATETFEVYPFPDGGAGVRQLLGQPGEIWGAESALDRIFVLYTTP